MRVLVTAVGGDVGQGVAGIIRRRFPDGTVIGSDASRRNAGPHIVDRFIDAPRSDRPDYLDWWIETCRTERLDAVIPCSDAELTVFAEAGPMPGPPVLMPAADVVRVGMDKWATAQFLATHAIPGPLTMPLEQADAMTYPCILKPRRGQGSRGVFVCASAEQARALATVVPDGLLQEALRPADEEFTCGVYRSIRGDIAVLALQRTLGGGATIWARVMVDPDIDAYCRDVAEALDLRGSVNIQLVRTSSGPRLFEINPRFSSTVAIRDALGFTDVVWTVQEAVLGESPTFAVPPNGAVAYRLAAFGIDGVTGSTARGVPIDNPPA